MLQRLTGRLFQPIDIASLVVFRVLFGGIMIWEVCRYFQHGWIRRYYIEPEFFFTYYGFSWVRPWPGDGMYWHFLAMGVLALFITVGFLYRFSALLFFLGFTYVFLLDQSNYLNHFYFISLLSFLMIFVPAHRLVSVDAWLRPRLRSPVVPAWGLFLLRTQLAIVYIYAGIAKINEDYLRGQPLGMWLAERADRKLFDRWPLGQLLLDDRVVWFFTYGGLLFDLFIIPVILWRRTRWLGFAAVAFFHLMNSWLFNIGVFPWISLAATIVLFLEPSWPRALLRRLGLTLSEFDETLPLKPSSRSKHRIVVSGLVIGYVALQLLVPLRHLLYPGSVHWTEEGHRFSWRMKLRDKSGRGAFWKLDPVTNETTPVFTQKHLTTRQRSKMLKTPDMILQFAHYIAQREWELNQRVVEVRANIVVSLNGREPQLMIDPTVDLAVVKRDLRHATWILPLETPLPTRENRSVASDDESADPMQKDGDEDSVRE